jgi:hypothetical protein
MEKAQESPRETCPLQRGHLMTEPEALQARRSLLLEQIGQAADEIAMIDSRLKEISGDNE